MTVNSTFASVLLTSVSEKDLLLFAQEGPSDLGLRSTAVPGVGACRQMHSFFRLRANYNAAPNDARNEIQKRSSPAGSTATLGM